MYSIEEGAMMTVQTTVRGKTHPAKRPNINKIRLMTDLILLVTMVLVISPPLTGIPLHEWIGFLVLIPLLFHLVVDWQWIVNTTKRLFNHQPGEVRFNYLLNWVQLLLLLLATVSGIAISEAVLPMFGVHVEIDRYWIAMHEISAGLFTVLMGVHIAMHWRWLVNTFRRHMLKQTGINQ
ncbi:MAG: DUF4405 domain-containing protein [Chloroflexota bacterium]